MKAPKQNPQSQIRAELESAGNRYDKSVDNVFAVLGSEPRITPELVEAIKALSEDLRIYSGAIRRMVAVSSHPAPTSSLHKAA